ncbi:MAG TPA: hypothetical protein ENN50_02200 [Prosthecochloris aestuarii]|uniref:DUF4905 domain-containing protein n=1 Tax=Prosthecochloris aestuarii TaxID=1102 RepID=A0A831WU92_PROAE|nr:hypothetical protein [Prosthecochloris aestuarii]
MNFQDKLIPVCAYRVEDGFRIWRIMFLDTGEVVGQVRSERDMSTSYFCVSSDGSGRIMQGFSPVGPFTADPERSWLTGLETTSGRLFFIHGYRDNGPEHKGLWAVDPFNGEVIWGRSDIAFVANLGSSLLVYRQSSFAGLPERFYQVLDASTGYITEEPGNDVARANQLRGAAPGEESRQGVLLPELYDGAQRSHFSDNARTIISTLPSRTVEVIERDEYLVCGLHHSDAVQPPDYHSELLVLRNGKNVFNTVLCRSSGYPCVNFYLIKDVNLYYVDSGKQLVVLHL